MMTSSNQSFKPRKIKTAKPPPHQPSPATTSPPVLKCPRCDSLNTKFCYYNNYSLSQPRHYCKNCRRYWTRGGALRNVPIGGSTRNKNKPCTTLPHVITTSQNVTSSSSSSHHHLLALDGFRMNNPPLPPPPPPPPSSTAALFSGYMFPAESSYNLASSSTTTSIESLSSLNQDLHHKLQQQRLMMTSMFLHETVPVNDKPVMFQNVPPSTVTPTDWFYDRSAMGRGGGATSGSNENNGEAEGNLGIWYHNALL